MATTGIGTFECYLFSPVDKSRQTAAMFPLLVVVATSSRRGDVKLVSLFELQILCIYESYFNAFND